MDAVPQFAHFYTMALAAASFSNDVYTDIPKTKDVPEGVPQQCPSQTCDSQLDVDVGMAFSFKAYLSISQF